MTVEASVTSNCDAIANAVLASVSGRADDSLTLLCAQVSNTCCTTRNSLGGGGVKSAACKRDAAVENTSAFATR